MAPYQLQSQDLSCDLRKWMETIFFSVHPHPRCHHPIEVTLHHRLKELYTVVGSTPKHVLEILVDQIETTLGEQVVLLDLADDTNNNRVKNATSYDWNSLLRHLSAHVSEVVGEGKGCEDEDGDHMVRISLKFVTSRVHRCFEEVDDNF